MQPSGPRPIAAPAAAPKISPKPLKPSMTSSNVHSLMKKVTLLNIMLAEVALSRKVALGDNRLLAWVGAE